MPVFNGEKYLREAVESILSQTFKDFKFIIIDDCSVDNSWRILNSYDNQRICIIRNETNLGLPKTRNIGLSLARGEYLAIMDADDISLPKRLERQVNFMDEHPEIGICGTWARQFGSDEQEVWKYKIKHEDIHMGLLFSNRMNHSSLMLRRKYLSQHNIIYDIFFEYAEDYDLYVRCAVHFKLANIPEVLVHCRAHENQVTKIDADKVEFYNKLVQRNQLERLGVNINADELNLHYILGKRLSIHTLDFINRIEDWLIKLIKANIATQYYQQKSFKHFIANKYFSICKQSVFKNIHILKVFSKSPLSVFFYAYIRAILLNATGRVFNTFRFKTHN